MQTFSNNRLLALVLLVSACTCEASNVWDGDLEAPDQLLEVNYKKEFEKINEYLVEAVPGDNKIELNMKKANELYNHLLTMNSFSPSRRKMIKALELFLSLGALEGKAKCNMESYRILMQNDRSADSVAHQIIHESELDELLNRVQRIVHDATVRHAEFCYTRYPEFFKEIYYKMDQTMVDRVEHLLDGYILSQKALGRESNSKKIYNRFVFQPEAMGAWNFAKALYDSTADLPVHSSTNNKVLSLVKKQGVHKKRTKQLIRERVIEPCQYFVRQLKDVFIPARYDAVFHREDDDDEYYMSWARFRLCNSLLHQDRRQLIREIILLHKEKSAADEE